MAPVAQEPFKVCKVLLATHTPRTHTHTRTHQLHRVAQFFLSLLSLRSHKRRLPAPGWTTLRRRSWTSSRRATGRTPTCSWPPGRVGGPVFGTTSSCARSPRTARRATNVEKARWHVGHAVNQWNIPDWRPDKLCNFATSAQVAEFLMCNAKARFNPRHQRARRPPVRRTDRGPVWREPVQPVADVLLLIGARQGADRHAWVDAPDGGGGVVDVGVGVWMGRGFWPSNTLTCNL